MVKDQQVMIDGSTLSTLAMYTGLQWIIYIGHEPIDQLFNYYILLLCGTWQEDLSSGAMAGSQSEAAAPTPAANPMAALLGGVLADFWL